MRHKGIINDYVGVEIKGFAGGYFGRDSYEDKIIVMNGADWVVALDTEGYPHTARFDDREELRAFIKEHQG